MLASVGHAAGDAKHRDHGELRGLLRIVRDLRREVADFRSGVSAEAQLPSIAGALGRIETRMLALLGAAGMPSTEPRPSCKDDLMCWLHLPEAALGQDDPEAAYTKGR